MAIASSASQDGDKLSEAPPPLKYVILGGLPLDSKGNNKGHGASRNGPLKFDPPLKVVMGGLTLNGTLTLTSLI